MGDNFVFETLSLLEYIEQGTDRDVDLVSNHVLYKNLILTTS